MKTTTETIDGKTVTVITADDGKEFVRTADGLRIGTDIYLGVDYSTGEPRPDRAEYYGELDIENTAGEA